MDQWLLILSIKMTRNTGVVSMLYFNSILVSYLVGLLRYGETPNMVMNLGVGLLAVGLYQTLFNSRDGVEGGADLDSLSGEEGRAGRDGAGLNHVLSNDNVSARSRDDRR